MLSDSTEAYDRGDKLALYRTVPSLQEYVIVSHRRPLVEHHARQPGERWVLSVFSSGERVTIVSCGCELQVDELYLKVFSELAPPG